MIPAVFNACTQGSSPGHDMLERLDETIAAISSAPGHGALGIVRLSGPDAIAIADSVAAVEGGNQLSRCPGSIRVDGAVFIDDVAALPAGYYLFRSPHSYTRQDIVEIHTLGSPAALEMVQRRLVQRGAVLARPGEFTARAFVNGAMDLGKAEAVAGVIRASTDTQLRASRRMMDGDFARRITALREELAELVALVEADIDFAEEPIEFITPVDARGRLSAIAARLRETLDGAVSIERFDALPHILLLGRPNVGKSTLMNRLSGTPRAICAAAAGTTRDILPAPVRLGRSEAILLDAAGVDYAADDVIAQARALTLSAAQRVDAVCLVVDVTDPAMVKALELVRSSDVAATVVALNKKDLAGKLEVQERIADFEAESVGRVVVVSASNGDGLEALRDALAGAIGEPTSTALGESVLVSERQQAALAEACEAVGRGIALCESAQETIDCADVLAFELRDALDLLGSVTGAVTTEDLLGQVFAKFCIGK